MKTLRRSDLMHPGDTLEPLTGACRFRNTRQQANRFLLAFLVSLLFVTHAWNVAARPRSHPAETVIQWNQLLIETLSAVPSVHPPTVRVERSYAMLHAAIFDAVNSIEQHYTPFRFQVRAAAGASAEAAAAQAGHDILIALYPSKGTNYDAALAATLARIPPGRARAGRRVGSAIAAQVLAWRSNDGWFVTPPTYVLPPDPGLWQPIPPLLRPAAFTHYPNVLPFAIETNTQFLVPPPPALDSPAYAMAFNYVKEIGTASNTVRSEDQTRVARLHASVGTTATPNTVWNGIARDVSRAAELGLSDTARVFALMNIVFHDALQVSFTGKYTYGLWRPVTAIVRGGEDSNNDTVEDPSWAPLLTSPPYPTYPGNAAALSAASARALALAFGRDDVPFDVVFKGAGVAPDIKRYYPGFWACAEEQAWSRVYGGIHFPFDSTASQDASVALVDWVAERFMVPR